MKTAVNKAQELRHSHQEDASFLVKPYVGWNGKTVTSHIAIIFNC
jgi:hypothetical protein